DHSHHPQYSRNAPTEDDTDDQDVLRYYTVSYSPTKGCNVVRPDGIVRNGRELRQSIQRATQAFLEGRRPVAQHGLPDYQRHNTQETYENMPPTTIDPPPRSQPVAVSLPGNVSLRRYIDNHREIKQASSRSNKQSYRAGVPGPTTARDTASHFATPYHRSQYPCEQHASHAFPQYGDDTTCPPTSPASDGSGMIFAMDEDAACADQIDPALTQSFSSVATDGDDNAPYSLVSVYTS
ncbi:hypothetical protein KEM55_001985, partial [Ascosphaera atra]